MDKTSLVRNFSRSYTKTLGLLNKQILESPLSLTESRIIFEINQNHNLTANDLVEILQIDKGHLSRVLKKLILNELIYRKISKTDKRQKTLSLTDKGKNNFKFINSSSKNQINQLLNKFNPYENHRFVASLGQALHLLEKDKKISLEDIQIKTDFEQGDLGFIIQVHGELYRYEFDYGIEFEQYVTIGLAEFIKLYDPKKSRIWMCTHNFNRIGFILVLDRGNEIAQLRYFFVFPEYRSIGLGNELMRLLVEFLKEKDYSECYLWTTNDLLPAGNLYLKYGFELVEEKPSVNFGKNLVEQKYNLKRPKV
jgi:DNA-binding MarR family transcriptional regulator/GNAT superfamily N-acetyltransferase